MKKRKILSLNGFVLSHFSFLQKKGRNPLVKKQVSRELEEKQNQLLGYLAKRIEVTLGLPAKGVENTTQTMILLRKIKVLHNRKVLLKLKPEMFKAPKVQPVFLCLQEPKQTSRTIQKQFIIWIKVISSLNLLNRWKES